jgi:predicted aspartyl protease
VVPDDEDEDAALLFVDGAVGGRSYRFLLDTGAARTSVRTDDYTAGFARVGADGSAGIFGESSGEDLIVVPSVHLGPIAKTDVTVARARGGPAGGAVVGMDLLADHRLHLLFSERRAAVDPPSEPAGEGQALVLDRSQHPYVEVYLGDTVAGAVFDTGAGITVVDLALARHHPRHFREVGVSRGTDATGATRETPTLLLSGARIGGRVFPPHVVAGVDLSHVNAGVELPLELVLGYSTLALADWWLDFPDRRWQVTSMTDRA